MQARRSQAAPRGTFSLRRTAILALVVFMHGMFVLLLLAPAAPVQDLSQPRPRMRGQRRGWVAVVLEHARKSSRTHASTRRTVTRRRRRPAVAASRPPPPRIPVALDRKPPSRPPAPLVLNPPDRQTSAAHENVPRYIPGGQAFQRRMQAARDRDRHEILPDNSVAGAPHFAMRDPQSTGLRGILHVLTHHLIGAQDPACVQAGTYMTMTAKQLRERDVDISDVKHTIFEHRCVLNPASWLAPQGPATHLTARPPGHGIE